jgi:serine/threonine-protein kinase RsbW
MLADRAQVPGIRALASDMAMREDFDLDTIEDIRLAVEEALAILIANGDPDGELACRMFITRTRVELSASVRVRAGRQPTVEPLSLRILRRLSDLADFWTTPGKGDELFHVQLTKSIA